MSQYNRYLNLSYHLQIRHRFFGKLTRAQAEKLLLQDGNPPGTYLIRESTSKPDQYALSVRDSHGVIKHYHIMNDGKYAPI